MSGKLVSGELVSGKLVSRVSREWGEGTGVVCTKEGTSVAWWPPVCSVAHRRFQATEPEPEPKPEPEPQPKPKPKPEPEPEAQAQA